MSVRRMLFTFAGGTGHFYPLVPFARAAMQAGHELAFGAEPRMLATVEAAGFTALDTGGQTLLETTERMPLLPVDMAREEGFVRDHFAGTIARERAARVRGICETWRSEVVVCDEIDFGSMVAAEALGIPHATVTCIGAGSLVRADLVGEPLNALRGEHGLAPDHELSMWRRHLVLSPFPPSLRDPRYPLPSNAHAIRWVAADRAGDDADLAWVAGRAARPLVYFTLGTIFNLESGDLFDRVLAGLRELPVDVFVTVGRELDPLVLGRQPSHVRVRGYVPQSLVLPHCDLVVSHGGSGSVVGALAHGVPMVLLPIGADQPLNAARCEELGVARVLDAFEATPDDVRLAAAKVLADATFKQNAKRFQAEIAALPDPEFAVRLLEHLIK